MVATDPQKHLFTLIRDFAAEKSQGERRVFNLKKRIEELRSELEAANAELENGKRLKETAEQELNGYEVELSMSETSIQTLELRIGLTQDEISKIGSDIDAIKNKESALRDEFINQMLDLKTKIRKFQELARPGLQQRSCIRTSSEHDHTGNEDAEIVGLEKELSMTVAQIAMEEQECEKEQNLQNQLRQELADSKRKMELIDGIMKAIKELQDLTRQTSALEERCASFSEELQSRCICPSCHFDNSEALAELLQEMENQ